MKELIIALTVIIMSSVAAVLTGSWYAAISQTLAIVSILMWQVERSKNGSISNN